MTDPIKRCVEKYMRSLKANNAQHPNDELPVRKLAEHMWVNLGNYFGDLHANASNFIWYIHYCISSSSNVIDDCYQQFMNVTNGLFSLSQVDKDYIIAQFENYFELCRAHINF